MCRPSHVKIKAQESKEGQILYDDNASAKPVEMRVYDRNDLISTDNMWLSSNGYIYPGEHLARYQGCTHYKCVHCGEVYEKNGYCESCNDKRQTEKWLKLPIIKWDRKIPLYSELCGDYYFDENEVASAIDDVLNVESLMLVTCKPTFYHEIDPDEYYYSKLPSEDGRIDDEVQEAFEKLNRFLSSIKEPISWAPDRFRVVEV